MSKNEGIREANRIIMDSFSELGPLDVQLTRENEITGRRSGLLSSSKFDSLQKAAFDLFQHFMLRIVMSRRRNQLQGCFRNKRYDECRINGSGLQPNQSRYGRKRLS